MPSRYLNQKLTWWRCLDTLPDGAPAEAMKLYCTDVIVPIDWRHPDTSTSIVVTFSRLKALHNPSNGSTFINPGGPGADGLFMPVSLAGGTTGRMRTWQDLYGFSPRGTGWSSNATCGARTYPRYDPRYRTAANLHKIVAVSQQVAANCDTYGGRVIDGINTEFTVRDVDLFRGLAGIKKVNWLGYSAGTWMGAHYATYYPHRTGRMVLDSNVEFTAGWQKISRWQPLGFERRYREDYAPWVASYDAHYHLGTDVPSVLSWIELLRRDLSRSPTPGTYGLMSGVALDSLIVSAMYTKDDFIPLTNELLKLRSAVVAANAGQPEKARALVAAVTASPLAQRMPSLNPGMAYYKDRYMATFLGTTCNDSVWQYPSESWLIQDSAATGAKYPLLGWGTLDEPCIWWKRPSVTLRHPTGVGIPQVLMIQSEHDPATPMEGALAAANKFGAAARLVRVTGEGDHGIYGGTNTCVNTLVDRFIVDGVMPTAGTTCAGTPLPDPTAQQQAGLATARNPLQRLADLTKRVEPARAKGPATPVAP